LKRVGESVVKHVEAMVEMKRRGAVAFEYGNNIRKLADLNGYKDAFEIPGYVPLLVRPLFCEGKGPFRWVALSGTQLTFTKQISFCLNCSQKMSICERGLIWHRRGLSGRVYQLAYVGLVMVSATKQVSCLTT